MLAFRVVLSVLLLATFVGAADPFAAVKEEMVKTWPKNRMVRFVFHGHSVPAGYFRAATVRRYDSYPTLFHQSLCDKYPTAVIDLCVTAIGGENSGKGSERFARDVLSLKPDVVFIDYALNDRGIGLEKAEANWRRMIEQCKEVNVPVVLLTPTADSKENILSEDAVLSKHAEQIRKLAAEYRLPLVDSYESFRSKVASGTDVNQLLSQPNHPNRSGHELVAELLQRLF